MSCQEECTEFEQQMSELRKTVGNLAAHNWELKMLILRHGDTQLKNRLEKIMKKYSGATYEHDAA